MRRSPLAETARLSTTASAYRTPTDKEHRPESACRTLTDENIRGLAWLLVPSVAWILARPRRAELASKGIETPI